MPPKRELPFASGREHSANRYLASLALSALSPLTRKEAYANAFWAATEDDEDKTALEILRLLEDAFHEIEFQAAITDVGGNVRKVNRSAVSQKSDAAFVRFLKDSYWLIPDKPLTETRFYILQKVAAAWCPDVTNAEVQDAFDFLMFAFNPSRARKKEPGVWENASLGKITPPEVKKLILDLFGLRSRVSSYFNADPDCLYIWIRRAKDQAPEIAEVLAIARAEAGGVKFVLQNARNAELLEPLRLEERSHAAIQALASVFRDIALVDQRISELIATMQQGYSFSEQHREIGGSEFVLGKIVIQTLWVDYATVTVTLDDSIGENLAQCVIGRARRHVEKWKASRPDISVNLVILNERNDILFQKEFPAEK